MKHYFSYLMAFAIFALSTLSIVAQDEKNKVEFFGGYSYMNTGTGLDEIDEDIFPARQSSHGFNTSITGNVHKWVGIKFDYSYHRKSESFSDGVNSADFRLTTNQFLGGLQFKNNKKDGPTVKPWAHVLAGIANQKVSGEVTFEDSKTFAPDGVVTTETFSESINNFAMVFGGGVDVKVHKNVDLRVVQFDYNPVFVRSRTFEDFTLPSNTQHNVRLSFGIVIHN